MLNLDDGTFWYLPFRCFEIEYFCFDSSCLILLCNIINLHFVVYSGKVEGLLEKFLCH